MGGSPPLAKGHMYDHPHRQRSVSPARHLEVGSLVEVQTDEKDFVDVFFSATVIPSSSKQQKYKKIHVEYHDLLACEGGSELLKEYVDVSFVRPLPPQELVTGLSPDDVVDAYYNDGWWTGVVKKVFKGGGRFRIKFQTPPDEREFGLSDLRIHWDWLDGNWSRPTKLAEAASVSEIGGNVEVSRHSKTHHSWFRSTILRRSSDDGAVLVTFSTLIDGEGGCVQGIVDPRDVRPCPPHLKDKPFVLREKVDTYFDFGWWAGVISTVLEGAKYVVYVAHTKTDKVFHQTELRPHMEWECGKWITSSKFSKGKHNTSESTTGNNTVAVSNNSGDRMKNFAGSTTKSRKHEKSHPVNQKPSKVTPPLSKRKEISSDSRDAPSRTLKRHKEGNVFRESEQDKRHDISITKMTLDSPSSVAAPLTAEDDQSSGIHSRVKTNPTKERELITAQSGDKVESPSLKIITQISQGKEPSTKVGSSVSGGSSRGAKGHSSNIKEKKPVSVQKKQPDHVAVQKLKDSTPSKTQASSNKRKRVRQPKEVQTPLKASKNGNDNEENAQNEVVAKDGLTTHESDQHIIAENGKEASLTNKESMLAAACHQPNPLTRGSAAETTSPKSSVEKLVNESMGLQPDGSTERGSKHVGGQTFESQVEGEKSLVPNPPTNESATETTSPKSNGEKLVDESMCLQPNGSTKEGSKPFDGQTFESRVEGKKSLVPDPLPNGSATETTSPKSNCEKLVKESMGLQPDGSTERGSKSVDGQTSESQVEGKKSPVPDPATNGSETEATSPKINGEKLVKVSMVLQPDGSSERGSKPVGGQTFESQVEGKKSPVPDRPTNGSATETTSPKINGEKLVKVSMVLQPDGSSERGSKPVGGQTFESQVEGKKSPVPDRPTNGSATETTSPKSNGKKLVKESMGLQPDESFERGSKPVDDLTSEFWVEDAPRSKTVEVLVLVADDEIMEEPLWNVVGDEPLSYSKGVSAAPNAGEIIQEAEKKASVLKKTKTGEQTPNSTEKILVDTPDEQQTLPFVKNAFLWETVESMEVFKHTPQKPHFQPLKQQKKGLREGLAIGYMVNFSNVIEKVSKLQFGDPDSITDDILDTLAELEAHGFDVGIVRDRVVGFVALGDKKKKLVVEANEFKNQIMVHSNEKCRIEKETSRIYEELRRLQEKASVAQLALDNENGEIACLHAKLLATEQRIENVELEFQGVVSSKY